MRKRKKDVLLQQLKRNPIVNILRSSIFKPKVVKSKKLYDRKKEKTSLKVATKTGELND